MPKDHPLIQKLNDGLKSFFKGNSGNTTNQDTGTANSGAVTDPLSATIAKKTAAAPPVSPSMLLDKAASNTSTPAMPPINLADGPQRKTEEDSVTTDPFETHSSHGRGAGP